MVGLDARRNLAEAGAEFDGKYATDVFTNEAVNIIDNHDAKVPLFLEVSHVAVHAEKDDILKVRDVDSNNVKYDYIKDERRRLFAGNVSYYESISAG